MKKIISSEVFFQDKHGHFFARLARRKIAISPDGKIAVLVKTGVPLVLEDGKWIYKAI